MLLHFLPKSWSISVLINILCFDLAIDIISHVAMMTDVTVSQTVGLPVIAVYISSAFADSFSTARDVVAQF